MGEAWIDHCTAAFGERVVSLTTYWAAISMCKWGKRYGITEPLVRPVACQMGVHRLALRCSSQPVDGRAVAP